MYVALKDIFKVLSMDLRMKVSRDVKDADEIYASFTERWGPRRGSGMRQRPCFNCWSTLNLGALRHRNGNVKERVRYIGMELGIVESLKS